MTHDTKKTVHQLSLLLCEQGVFVFAPVMRLTGSTCETQLIQCDTALYFPPASLSTLGLFQVVDVIRKCRDS